MKIEYVESRDLERAADKLAACERGRIALRVLLDWLDDSGTGLDADNQHAVLTLLGAAWGKYSMTTRDVMRERIGE